MDKMKGSAVEEAQSLLDDIGKDVVGTSFKSRVVLPGDDLTDDIEPIATKIRTGHGIEPDSGSVVATKCGRLRFRMPNRFWVANSQRRYIPRVGDSVIGVVIESHAEEYRVNVGAYSGAVLPTLAFDGASRRNRPMLRVGDVVHARVVLAIKDIDPTLTCCAKENQTKKDWVTGESVYGELKDGTIFRCSLSLATKLRDPNCVVLNELGSSIPFEIVVGSNGMVWVDSETTSNSILIMNAIRNSEHISETQTKFMVEKLVRNLQDS